MPGYKVVKYTPDQSTLELYKENGNIKISVNFSSKTNEFFKKCLSYCNFLWNTGPLRLKHWDDKIGLIFYIFHIVKDGGIAIIDQLIASHAKYFIGSYESTFSFRIQEEREIMGFPAKVPLFFILLLLFRSLKFDLNLNLDLFCGRFR
jgi:hypothetical protein